jgi:hypothetical protein
MCPWFASVALSVIAVAGCSSSAPMQVGVCDLLTHPFRYEGKTVEFEGFRSPDVEMLLINNPKCAEKVIVIGDSVRGSFNELLPDVSGGKPRLPYGVFRGVIRVEKGPEGVIGVFLDDGVIVRSGLKAPNP